MSRRTYTPFDFTTNEMSAAVMVMEYIAPLSMITRRTGERMLLDRYCADLRVTVHILNASRAWAATLGLKLEKRVSNGETYSLRIGWSRASASTLQ